jgi:CheY-like chemotaxis protein
VVINLVGNAVKFTSSGTVTLRLATGSVGESDRPGLVIEVEDTGRGIGPEDRKRIFEPFVQLDHSDQTGTGLGLTITRQYVELMGGVIELESTPGHGSKFRIEMPMEISSAPVGALVVGADRTVAHHVAPGQPDYRVLIVEDEEVNAMLLRRLMEGAGFQVRVAEDGAMGVEAFQSWRPHLIWMDWRLPVMDGLEATRRIRTLKGGQEVKIVVVSASVFKDEREQMLAAGADDVLPKPIQFKQMYDCLTRQLGVRFIRGDSRTTGAADRDEPLKPDAIAALSQELRRELVDALVSLDRVRIADAIQSVSAVDPDLGGTLAHHADRLEYSFILRAVQAAPGSGI